jgi:hypothetical protein
MKKKFPKLGHGDRVEVTWLDIVGDPIGDPDRAEVAYCQTMGYFHAWKGRGKNRALVLCLTVFPKEGDACRGYDTYPFGVIKQIEVLHARSSHPVQVSDGDAKPGAPAALPVLAPSEPVAGRHTEGHLDSPKQGTE